MLSMYQRGLMVGRAPTKPTTITTANNLQLRLRKRQAQPQLVSSAAVQAPDQAVVEHRPAAATARNLVVAVDQSLEAWNAVKWTLDNLYRSGDVLHLMHVIPQGFSSVRPPVMHLHQIPLDGDVQERVAEEIEHFIQSNYVVLAAKYNAQCQIDLVKGGCREAIGAAICKKSAALSAAAVVVPEQPRNPVLELFKGGSVAKHVAHHCTQPTIILH